MFLYKRQQSTPRSCCSSSTPLRKWCCEIPSLIRRDGQEPAPAAVRLKQPLTQGGWRILRLDPASKGAGFVYHGCHCRHVYSQGTWYASSPRRGDGGRGSKRQLRSPLAENTWGPSGSSGGICRPHLPRRRGCIAVVSLPAARPSPLVPICPRRLTAVILANWTVAQGPWQFILIVGPDPPGIKTRLWQLARRCRQRHAMSHNLAHVITKATLLAMSHGRYIHPACVGVSASGWQTYAARHFPRLVDPRARRLMGYGTVISILALVIGHALPTLTTPCIALSMNRRLCHVPKLPSSPGTPNEPTNFKLGTCASLSEGSGRLAGLRCKPQEAFACDMVPATHRLATTSLRMTMAAMGGKSTADQVDDRSQVSMGCYMNTALL